MLSVTIIIIFFHLSYLFIKMYWFLSIMMASDTAGRRWDIFIVFI